MKPGDYVEVKKFSTIGLVVSVDGSSARVQLAGAVVKLKIADLKLSDQAPQPATNHRKISISSAAVDAGHAALFSIDLHGKTTAEAVELLEKQVSRAVMAGMHEIEVVHGLGSGKIQQAIHKRLASLPAVAKFELKYTNRGVTRVFLRA